MCCRQELVMHTNVKITRKGVFISYIVNFSQQWQALRYSYVNSLTFVPVQNVCSQVYSYQWTALESFLFYSNLPSVSCCFCSVLLWLGCIFHHSWQEDWGYGIQIDFLYPVLVWKRNNHELLWLNDLFLSWYLGT